MTALDRIRQRHPLALVGVAALAWVQLYRSLDAAAHAIVGLLPLDPASHLHGALHFLLFETPKVLKPRLIGVFVAVVTVGILAVGFTFNALLGRHRSEQASCTPRRVPC